jgi:predicted O-methyltransferase YrrM
MRQQVKVFLALFAYGGNGGISSLIPELTVWAMQAYYKLRTDPRVEAVGVKVYSDTPIYMTRNKAVEDAIDSGADFLLMLDSDNEPDAYLIHDQDAEPFLGKPFDFAFERLCRGIPTVIAAPYCGPPPPPRSQPGWIDNGEVPYLFQLTNKETIEGSRAYPTMLTRLEASRLKGIVPMWALPTGVCMFSTNVFKGPPTPYFDYEHDPKKTEKRGTEDCFATRNLSLYWHTQGVGDVCFAACDSWAWHHKPKRVGRPEPVTMEEYSLAMREAILKGHSSASEQRHVDYTSNLPPALGAMSPVDGLPRRGQVLRHDQDEVLITEEEMDHARILAEREAATGSELADIRPSNPAVEEMERLRGYVEAAEASGSLWIDEQYVDPDYSTVTVANDEEHKGNGKAPLMHRMICGRKVASLPTEVPEESIDAIQALTAWAARNGPIEVAVATVGAGQSAAAILHELPEGSHLYALDCLQAHQFNAQPGIEFAKSFQPELESGRVMADIGGRRFPWPEGQQHLDMVFIERSANEEKLAKWLPHISDGGVLAGLEYKAKSRQIDSFAEENGLKSKTIGDVWALVK